MNIYSENDLYVYGTIKNRGKVYDIKQMWYIKSNEDAGVEQLQGLFQSSFSRE